MYEIVALAGVLSYQVQAPTLTVIEQPPSITIYQEMITAPAPLLGVYRPAFVPLTPVESYGRFKEKHKIKYR